MISHALDMHCDVFQMYFDILGVHWDAFDMYCEASGRSLMCMTYSPHASSCIGNAV